MEYHDLRMMAEYYDEHKTIIKDENCACLNNGLCNLQRHFYVYDIKDNRKKVISVCNEYIRLKVADYEFKKYTLREYYDYRQNHIVVIEDILKCHISINTPKLTSVYNKEKEYSVRYLVCSNPTIWSEINIYDAIELFVGEYNDTWYHANNTRLFEYMLHTLNTYLSDLYRLKKYIKYHNMADRILKHIKRHESINVEIAQELIQLILTLKK